MKLKRYLIIGKGARSISVRVTQTSPALKGNEIAMLLSITIPDRLFQKPQLQAEITIPESAVTKKVLSAEIIDNVESIIRQSSEIDLQLKIIDVTEKEEEDL